MASCGFLQGSLGEGKYRDDLAALPPSQSLLFHCIFRKSFRLSCSTVMINALDYLFGSCAGDFSLCLYILKVKSAKVLCVGAGGIGCELLKTLVMIGFEDIELVWTLTPTCLLESM